METSNLNQLGRTTFALFDQALKVNCPSNFDHDRFGDLQQDLMAEHDRFKIWAIDMGLLAPGHGSLDYRVRDSITLPYGLQHLLGNLNECLRDIPRFLQLESQPLVSPSDGVRNNSSGAQHETHLANEGMEDGFIFIEDDEEQGEFDLMKTCASLLAGVRRVIGHLFELSAKIRRSSKRTTVSKARLHREVDPETGIDLMKSFEQHDHNHLRSIFYEYESKLSNELQHRHRQLMRQDQCTPDVEHESNPCQACTIRPNSVDKDDSREGELLPDRELLEGVPLINVHLVHRFTQANGLRRKQFMYWKKHGAKLEEHVEKHLSTLQVPTIPVTDPPGIQSGHPFGETQIRTLHPPSVTTATHLDPVLFAKIDGKSTVSVTEYAPSAYDPGEKPVCFPLPPVSALKGEHFACPYCLTLCPKSMLSTRAWQAHLIHDLHPYQCTYRACETAPTLYETRRDWVQHENSCHRKVWSCPDHLTLVFFTKDNFTQHIKSEHAVDAGVMLNPYYLESCETTPRGADRDCPICFKGVDNPEKLISHIARHLERFSLFSLPRSTDEGESNDVSAKSSVAVDQDPSSRADDFSDSISGVIEARAEPDRSDSSETDEMTTGGIRNESQYHPTDTDSTEDRLGDDLHSAIRDGLVATAAQLIDQGADVKGPNKNGALPLYVAAFYGHKEIMRMLLDHGAAVNATETKSGGTALHAAVMNGHLELVQILLQKGADMHLEDNEQMTPLESAASRNRAQIVQLLLDKAIDTQSWKRACQVASDHSHEEILSILFEPGNRANLFPAEIDTIFIEAVKRGDAKIVASFLQSAIDIFGSKDMLGRALSAAAEGGWADVIRILIRGGADVNTVSNGGASVLTRAAMHGHEEAVQSFLDAGADVNKPGGHYGSALQAAASNASLLIVRRLLDAGADVDKVLGHYGTALQAASAFGHREVVQTLLNAGADPNAEGGTYGNALMAAARNNKQETLDILCEAGAAYRDNVYHRWQVYLNNQSVLVFGVEHPLSQESSRSLRSLLLTSIQTCRLYALAFDDFHILQKADQQHQTQLVIAVVDLCCSLLPSTPHPEETSLKTRLLTISYEQLQSSLSLSVEYKSKLLLCLGAMYQERNSATEAQKLFQEYLDMTWPVPGKDGSLTYVDMDSYIKAQSERGPSKATKQLLEQLHYAREYVLGASHPDTTRTEKQLRDVEEQLGENWWNFTLGHGD